MGVTVTKNNVAKVVAAVGKLTSRQVLIGIPAEAANRQDGSFGNAAIGYVQEFGSPVNNIPPRPHLVPGVEKAAPQAAKALQIAGKAALQGDMSKVEDGFDKAGLLCQSSVRATIAAVLPPPLSPKTISARQRRGNAGETPLIDTGAYNQAITYVVRDKD